MTMLTHLWLIARSRVRRALAASTFGLLAAGLAGADPAPEAKPVVPDRVVAVGRLRFTVGANALPEQIDLQPAPLDLPLELRAEKAPPPDIKALAALGRGPQLAAPLRLEATVRGTTAVLAPKEPAPLNATEKPVVARSTVTGQGVTATIAATYAPDGALNVAVTYGGGAVEALALVMELNGPVDTVVSGGAPFAGDVSLPEGDGVLWGNAAPPVPATDKLAAPVNSGAPGVPRHLFWGNGDRGFTWLCDDPKGWTVTPVAPTIILTRSKEGAVTWRALLVNHPAELKAEQTVSFTLLTHPATTPKPDQREYEWLTWPTDGPAAKALPLTAAGRAGAPGVVRADCAAVYESVAAASLLEGVAGGDARSATGTLADAHPLGLFRYLAGTHTGLPVRLKSNASQLSRPGMNPGADRMAVGRALLHDVGFDPESVAHLAMLGRLVAGLTDFGFFAGDGKIEFLPYWRSSGVVRYGEPFNKDDAFAEATVNPMGRVHTSVWLRPPAAGKKGKRAQILVVNEGDQPVREQLYVLAPNYVFGGPNGFRKTDMVGRWDGAGLPKDSDWALDKLRREATPSTDLGVAPSGNIPFLLDLEDGGGVAQSVAANGIEVYHRLYIPARGFRLLFGAAEP